MCSVSDSRGPGKPARHRLLCSLDWEALHCSDHSLELRQGLPQGLNHALSPARQVLTEIAPRKSGEPTGRAAAALYPQAQVTLLHKVILLMVCYPLQASPRIRQQGAPSGSGAGARSSCPGRSSVSSTYVTPSAGGRTLSCSRAAAPALRMLRSLKLRASLCQHLYSLLQRHRQ